MVSFDKMMTFILHMCKKYNIDASHSEGHSLEVLNYAHSIYEDQLIEFPFISKHKNIIYSSALLHDMCDRKYVDPGQGLVEIQLFLETQLTPKEIYYSKEIMNTMSYSKVKKFGYPDLGDYQVAYHIVREADLLTSYDFDRAMIYDMNRGFSLTDSYINSVKLFNDRVFQYNENKLFITDYSTKLSYGLANQALYRIKTWAKILRI